MFHHLTDTQINSQLSDGFSIASDRTYNTGKRVAVYVYVMVMKKKKVKGMPDGWDMVCGMLGNAS